MQGCMYMDSFFKQFTGLPFEFWFTLALILVVFLIISLIIVNVIYFCLYRKLIYVNEQISGKRVYNIFHGPSIVLKYRNIWYRIYIQAEGFKKPLSLNIKRNNPFNFKLLIIKTDSVEKSSYKKLLKAQELNPEGYIFDEELIIRTNSIDSAGTFLQSNSNVQVIQFLLQNGFEEIIFKDKFLIIKKSDISEEEYKKMNIEQVLHALDYFNV